VLVQLACGEAAHGPGLLLLDEPTANLDLRHQLDVMAAASARAARGVTVVAILHDLNLAALLAKRIVVLDHGRIDSDGEPGRVITDAMLERVLGVANAVGRTPAEGTPFVLPHAARKLLPGKS
jgi:iron complex transport system ATP-binding protein